MKQEDITEQKYPELKGMLVLNTLAKFNFWLTQHRKSKQKETRKREAELRKNLRMLKELESKNDQVIVKTSFAILNEPDDMTKNDGWGSYYLYKIIILIRGDSYELAKEQIETFAH